MTASASDRGARTPRLSSRPIPTSPPRSKPRSGKTPASSPKKSSPARTAARTRTPPSKRRATISGLPEIGSYEISGLPEIGKSMTAQVYDAQVGQGQLGRSSPTVIAELDCLEPAIHPFGAFRVLIEGDGPAG